jgi:hypothetical protein
MPKALRHFSARTSILPIANSKICQHSSNLLSTNLHCGIFPAFPREVSNASPRHQNPLCKQQGALGKQISPVTAQLAPGRNDAMARYGRIAGRAHDVADRAMGARAPGGGRDVTIGRDPPMRYASNDMAHSRGEI